MIRWGEMMRWMEGGREGKMQMERRRIVRRLKERDIHIYR